MGLEKDKKGHAGQRQRDGKARAKAFAEIVKRQRWTQSEAARELSITRNHVNMILRGRAEPSAALLSFLQQKVRKNEELDPKLALVNDLLKTLSQRQKDIVMLALDNVIAIQREMN